MLQQSNDTLKTLLDRDDFATAAEQALATARRRRKTCVLIFATLEGLEEVKDTLGSHSADELITHAATLLKDMFRESDLIGRWENDEFAILTSGAQDVTRVKQRILNGTEDLRERGDCPYRISFSVGVLRCEPDDERSIDELMDEAQDVMWNERKASGPREPTTPVRH